MSIKENIARINQLKQEAAERTGRKGEDVLLVAVTKLHDPSEINEAIDCGITDIGENKVQELLEKYEFYDKRARIHFIGRLQTNKVKYIVDKAVLIHSVDSIKLAQTIQKESEKHNVVSNILIEVNVAQEDTKFGLHVEEVEDFIREISGYSHIKVCGLMTIAPYVENPEENRQYFRRLKQLLLDINSKNIDNINMNVLSMGMTNDYQVAIEEGATMVRVGTGIFGERDYSI